MGSDSSPSGPAVPSDPSAHQRSRRFPVAVIVGLAGGLVLVGGGALAWFAVTSDADVPAASASATGAPEVATEPVVTPGGDPYAGPVGDGEGTLRVLAWPGYAEDGSTDPAIDWVTPFERATGCRVDVRVFGTSDEAVTLMQDGGYDVVSASGDATLRLIRGGTVQPVNTDLIPNYADIVPDLKGTPHTTVGGRTYGVPQGRGVNLLIWNRQELGDDVDSWSVMFEPDSAAAGGVGPYDSPISIADAAVYLSATRPELGITDPFALDQEQFAAVIALLEQQRALVDEYWSDNGGQIDAVNAGTMTAATSWQSTVDALDPALVGFTKPKEGATGWSDTWMIARDTPNIDCAYRWLDWMASPRINAQVAEWSGQAPAHRRACALTADPEHCSRHHADDPEYWEDVHYWTTPVEDCLDGRTDVRCVPYPEWLTAWSMLRSSG